MSKALWQGRSVTNFTFSLSDLTDPAFMSAVLKAAPLTKWSRGGNTTDAKAPTTASGGLVAVTTTSGNLHQRWEALLQAD